MSSDRSQAEGLDEESLDLDPLEAGIEPPERWAESTKHGMTPNEAREGEDLDSRLSQEEPDTQPGAAGDVDERPTDDLPPGMNPLADEAARRGQTADEAGGSVARSLREDHPGR
ncbi:hypothetical protein ACFQV2_22250 [Actinokineospora soli]|uniref:DUF5709 domain-containing protein n=1 Tax=Actinokineospora soli TaxID=1048753 RepID=A0ABW2TQ44_9PSEU